MSTAGDVPFAIPEPRALAERAMDRAWADSVHDIDRELLESCAVTINSLLARLAAAGEREEARRGFGGGSR